MKLCSSKNAFGNAIPLNIISTLFYVEYEISVKPAQSRCYEMSNRQYRLCFFSFELFFPAHANMQTRRRFLLTFGKSPVWTAHLSIQNGIPPWVSSLSSSPIWRVKLSVHVFNLTIDISTHVSTIGAETSAFCTYTPTHQVVTLFFSERVFSLICERLPHWMYQIVRTSVGQSCWYLWVTWSVYVCPRLSDTSQLVLKLIHPICAKSLLHLWIVISILKLCSNCSAPEPEKETVEKNMEERNFCTEERFSQRGLRSDRKEWL